MLEAQHRIRLAMSRSSCCATDGGTSLDQAYLHGSELELQLEDVQLELEDVQLELVQLQLELPEPELELDGQS